MRTPRVDELGDVVRALGAWQLDGAPTQLHPGDIGWYWRFGAAATAASLRTWIRDGQVLAVGQVDPDEVRLAIAPAAWDDEPLAQEMVHDVTRAERGVCPDRTTGLEANWVGPFRALLVEDGWEPAEAWSPLARGLQGSVEECGVRVEVVGPELAPSRTAIQRAAFEGSTFTDERWHVMAAGPLYRDARCLVAFDGHGDAVAATTVWSAGAGKPGLLEPLGVHRAHRGHGYGRSIALAAAAALKELGASRAIVCTPSSNVAAVATYTSAGFRAGPETRNLRRRA